MAPAARLTPPELAVMVCGALRSAGIEHAVGGALALGFYAEPRGTYDLDLNIFVAAEEADAALDVLRGAGIEMGDDAADVVAERGDIFLAHGGCRLDLFFNSIPLHSRAARRTRTVSLLGERVPILSPEDLIVLKLLFNRHRDIVDIECIVAAVGERLERGYVRAAIIECVGEKDARLATWEAASASPPRPAP